MCFSILFITCDTIPFIQAYINFIQLTDCCATWHYTCYGLVGLANYHFFLGGGSANYFFYRYFNINFYSTFI